jgi:hypothetical protein
MSVYYYYTKVEDIVTNDKLGVHDVKVVLSESESTMLC